jgi:hypothetical protein
MCLLVGGCSAWHQPVATNDTLESHRYAPSAAASLAFDAPIAAGYDLPGLDRDARQPGVFMGYQDSVTESFSIGMYDNQSNDPYCDVYNRWSYTEKVGTRYR